MYSVRPSKRTTHRQRTSGRESFKVPPSRASPRSTTLAPSGVSCILHRDGRTASRALLCHASTPRLSCPVPLVSSQTCWAVAVVGSASLVSRLWPVVADRETVHPPHHPSCRATGRRALVSVFGRVSLRLAMFRHHRLCRFPSVKRNDPLIASSTSRRGSDDACSAPPHSPSLPYRSRHRSKEVSRVFYLAEVLYR